MRSICCALALLLLGGCTLFRAPRLGQLEGWVVTEGAQVDELAARAGVTGVIVGGLQVGNIVRLSAHHALSVRHVVPEDQDLVARFLESPSAVTVLETGSPDRPNAWTLLEFEQAFTSPSVSLPLGGDVRPGQEALVLGFSQGLSAGRGFACVAVRARLLAWPPAYVEEFEDFLLVDAGDRAAELAGLSGSPLLTRDGPEAEWRWVGLLEAGVGTSANELLAMAVKLPIERINVLLETQAPLTGLHTEP